MEFKLTEKDKNLLVFLAAFLVIIGFVVLLILPAAEKKETLETQVQEAQGTKDTMEAAILTYSSLQTQYSALTARASEALKDYYPIMTSQEIDRELTGLVLAQQVEAVNLNIVMNDGVKLEPYAASALALQTSAAGAMGDESADSSGNSASGGTSGDDGAVGGQEGRDISSTLRSAAVTLSVQGTREQLNAILDTLFRDCPGIHISRYSISDSRGENEEKLPELNVSMDLYMCDKESVR